LIKILTLGENISRRLKKLIVLMGDHRNKVMFMYIDAQYDNIQTI